MMMTLQLLKKHLQKKSKPLLHVTLFKAPLSSGAFSLHIVAHSEAHHWKAQQDMLSYVQSQEHAMTSHTPFSRRSFIIGSALFALNACTQKAQMHNRRVDPNYNPALFPNETPELRALINKWADHYEIPRELIHRQAIRESTHRPWAHSAPYYGLLQILPQTARTMGHRGPASDLLKADVNLQWAGKYLKGAYLVSNGDIDRAMKWYARGYYYEAKRLGLLEETGLR
jgi:soluble lytic murein transglycosylase-like protein